ncbi:MAG: substrate-binding domain-containing protein [Lachnospiraceae bacterium]|nr:substrate-binding domain-containing protein [Lachnospiraceae bacterium]
MKKKLLAALLSTAMVATLLSGCGSSSSSSTETETEAAEEETEEAAEETEEAEEETAEAVDNSSITLEIVSKGLQHQYWQAVLQGVNNKAEELGVTVNFVGPDSESDIQVQVTELQAALDANPSAIGLAALDTSAVSDLLEQAKEAGIPVIGFDSGVPDAPEGSVYATCATDNYAAGELAAEKVYEAIADRIASADGSVRIGVVAQDATSESVINRGLGFIDKMGELAEADGKTVGMASNSNEKYISDSALEADDSADVIIEVLVPASVTSELSATDATTLMNKEDTIAIYGSNEHSANAMITANENLGVLGTGDDQIIAAGFDSGASIKAAVADGTFLGAITQAPVAMGETLVELLVAAANGEEVEDVDTGCQWYTADNMDDEEIAQNLYD